MLILIPIYAQGADIIDMVPYESLAYISISHIDDVHKLVTESPEWQELMGIEEIQEDLNKTRQGISLIPAFLGISMEDTLETFGSRMVVSLIGMQGTIPIACIIVDIEDNKDKAEQAVNQLNNMAASSGDVIIDKGEYRDVTYTLVKNESMEIKHSFVDNYLIVGTGGGFESIVNRYKGDGKSIKDSPNFQSMKQKISLEENICVYADLERASSLIRMLAKMDSEEKSEEEQFQRMMMEFMLESTKSLAISLSLTGHLNEVYLHVEPENSNPIADMIFSPHSPMSSANLIPFDDGVMVGINLGEPAEMLDRGIKLIRMQDEEKAAKVEDHIRELERGLNIDLRDDFLSTLTGEFAMMAALPEEKIDLKSDDKLKTIMQMSKVRQVVVIGVKDERKLGRTVEHLMEIVDIEPISLDDDDYRDEEIRTKVIPLSNIAPGLALLPVYSFGDDRVIMSNNAEWVRDAIDMFKSPKYMASSSIQVVVAQVKLSDSRVMVYMDAGSMMQFMMEQDIADEMDIPEKVQDKLASMGSIAAGLYLGTDGAGLRLISTSDDVWATKLLNGALIATYSNIEKKKAQKKAQESEMKE
jgi:hypothetical protein